MLKDVPPPPSPSKATSSRPKREGHGRRPLPKELPRQQVVHELSEDEKKCPCCGEVRVRIGQETSEGYDHLFKPRSDGAPSPTEVACWAHARRKFVEAQTSDAFRAHTAVAMIKLLYDVEREAKELDAEARRALRQEKSVPHLARIEAWLEENRPQVLPKSPMGDAISFCLGNWKAFCEYVNDGDLAIDNNPVENPPATT